MSEGIVTAKYPCDFVCACPASNTVEQVEKEVIAKILEAVEGLAKVELWGGTDVVVRTDVIQAIEGVSL